MEEAITKRFENLLSNMGMGHEYAIYVELITYSLVLIVVCMVTNYITKRFILKGVEALTTRTKNSWDDVLVDEKVFRTLSHVVPGLIIKFSIGYVLRNFEWMIPTVNQLTNVYIEVFIALTLINFINALSHFLLNSVHFKDKPIESFRQLVNIIVYIGLAILIVAELSGIEPMAIVTGMSALMVVIVLVFKDTLLGFVASIQIASNNMLRVGDWVEFSKFGADGDVVELNLTTVKIQNWDKTISTIPTYAFISEAFKNWRGMEESGGRRIKRAVHIDMNSVQFMDQAMISKAKKFHSITKYITDKQTELAEYNTLNKIDDSVLVNGRRLTNLGTFRTYIESYLRENEHINHNMTFMVRQLAPGPNGIPIEVYVFAKEQRWKYYEQIQADIFDHIIAVIPEFGLRVFQNPTGIDFRKLGGN